MSSKKAKWKNSVQKARRVSQSSSAHSTRKSSIIEEETAANELEEYLETLKKKSGIKSLWRGDSFDRVVRDEEDKTPDISISSTDDHEELGKISASPISRSGLVHHLRYFRSLFQSLRLFYRFLTLNFTIN